MINSLIGSINHLHKSNYILDNPHELMRALEVQDIIDISELHAQSSILRTDSRLTG